MPRCAARQPRSEHGQVAGHPVGRVQLGCRGSSKRASRAVIGTDRDRAAGAARSPGSPSSGRRRARRGRRKAPGRGGWVEGGGGGGGGGGGPPPPPPRGGGGGGGP